MKVASRNEVTAVLRCRIFSSSRMIMKVWNAMKAMPPSIQPTYSCKTLAGRFMKRASGGSSAGSMPSRRTSL
ncbi:hypothetical protein D3C83_210340 [compost metagenome]